MAELFVPSRSSTIRLPGGLHRRIDRDSPPTFASPSSVLCGICSQTPFVYTCPRCNVKYCSRTCYQAESHSSCSETFYRDCCMQSLGEVGTDDDKRDREKVARILKVDAEARQKGETEGQRGKEEEEEEEEESLGTSTTPELSDRIANMDLDDAEDLDRLWERLTPSEKADFEAQLRDGEAAKWLLGNGKVGGETGISTPWWRAPLIVEADDEAEGKPSSAVQITDFPPRKSRPPPPISANAKPLSSLTNCKPSSTIPNNLVNILFAYVYCWRLYNGDQGESAESAVEFLHDFLAISTVVDGDKKENFDSVAASLCAAVTALGSGVVVDRALFCSNDFTATAMEDVAALCAEGRESVARALSDVRAAATLAAGTLKKSETENVVSTTAKRKTKSVKAVVKKLEFYLSWVVEYGEERLGGLASCASREAWAYRKKIQSVQMQSKIRESDDD